LTWDSTGLQPGEDLHGTLKYSHSKSVSGHDKVRAYFPKLHVHLWALEAEQ